MCVVWKDVFNCLTSGGRRKRNRESEKERGKRHCDVERKRGRSWKEGLLSMLLFSFYSATF